MFESSEDMLNFWNLPGLQKNLFEKRVKSSKIPKPAKIFENPGV